jgi:hypothetical protein
MAVPHKVRAANHTADHTSSDRADRSSNDGTGARTDGNAFQRSGLSYDGQRRQR